MGVKYSIAYTSVNDIAYRCAISNPEYKGDVVPVRGRVVYAINSVADYSTPIRSKYLDISLVATIEQNFEDLLVAPERYWRVEFFRDGRKIFFGYLSSEQAQQSFTDDTWILNVQALGPLAFLEDLGYFGGTGEVLTGVVSFINILSSALLRGFQQETEAFNIRTVAPYYWRILNSSTNTTTDITTANFIKECGIEQNTFFNPGINEALSCLEVLELILTSLQLTITQIAGDTWLILPYKEDVNTRNQNFGLSFNSEGDYIENTTVFVPTTQIKGLEAGLSDVLDTIHCNANQKYYYQRGIDKLAVTNDFLFRASLVFNPNLIALERPGGPGWETKLDQFDSLQNKNFDMARGFDGYIQLYNAIRSFLASEAIDDFGFKSDRPAQVLRGQKLKLKINYSADYPVNDGRTIRYQVVLSLKTSTGYLYANSSGWSSGIRYFDVYAPSINKPIELGLEVPDIPNDGQITLLFYGRPAARMYTQYFTFYSIDLLVMEQNAETTGTTTIFSSSNTKYYKSTKTSIFINTSEGEFLANQIYNIEDALPVIAIDDTMALGADGYETLAFSYVKRKMEALQLRRFFTGDFYNFFEPSNQVRLTELCHSRFKVIAYEFDTYANTGTIKLEEVSTELIDGTIETTFIYPDNIDPTIK